MDHISSLESVVNIVQICDTCEYFGLALKK